jgi:hypothetical protein
MLGCCFDGVLVGKKIHGRLISRLVEKLENLVENFVENLEKKLVEKLDEKLVENLKKLPNASCYPTTLTSVFPLLTFQFHNSNSFPTIQVQFHTRISKLSWLLP